MISSHFKSFATLNWPEGKPNVPNREEILLTTPCGKLGPISKQFEGLEVGFCDTTRLNHSKNTRANPYTTRREYTDKSGMKKRRGVVSMSKAVNNGFLSQRSFYSYNLVHGPVNLGFRIREALLWLKRLSATNSILQASVPRLHESIVQIQLSFE